MSRIVKPASMVPLTVPSSSFRRKLPGIESLEAAFGAAGKRGAIEVRLESELRHSASHDIGVVEPAGRIELHCRERRRRLAGGVRRAVVPAGVRGKLPVTSKVPLMRLLYDGFASASIFNAAPMRSRSRLATVPRAP